MNDPATSEATLKSLPVDDDNEPAAPLTDAERAMLESLLRWALETWAE